MRCVPSATLRARVNGTTPQTQLEQWEHAAMHGMPASDVAATPRLLLCQARLESLPCVASGVWLVMCLVSCAMKACEYP
jgi:hypothetical protein